jgi:hypothetical protein
MYQSNALLYQQSGDQVTAEVAVHVACCRADEDLTVTNPKQPLGIQGERAGFTIHVKRADGLRGQMNVGTKSSFARPINICELRRYLSWTDNVDGIGKGSGPCRSTSLSGNAVQDSVFHCHELAQNSAFSGGDFRSDDHQQPSLGEGVVMLD